MQNKRKVFSNIWRIHGKYLSVHEEYNEFKVVYGTQNCLRIREKYFNLFREYTESILAHTKKTPKESCRILLIRQQTYLAKTKKV